MSHAAIIQGFAKKDEMLCTKCRKPSSTGFWAIHEEKAICEPCYAGSFKRVMGSRRSALGWVLPVSKEVKE